MKSFNLAILIACHNRVKATEKCLAGIKESIPSTVNYSIYLVDDGSNDGTAEMARAAGLNLRVIIGTGYWYWARSMNEAEVAIDSEPDAILWLNDDVILDVSKFSRFLEDAQSYTNSVIVGQTSDAGENFVTYGGYKRIGSNPLKYQRVYAKDSVLRVDTFNGNIVFIPKEVSRRVGSIDGKFAHGYADCDYGLRVTNMGLSNLVLPGFIGVCPRNNDDFMYRSRIANIRRFVSKKHSPLSSQVRFFKRHGGALWPLYVVSPFVSIILGRKQFIENDLVV